MSGGADFGGWWQAAGAHCGTHTLATDMSGGNPTNSSTAVTPVPLAPLVTRHSLMSDLGGGWRPRSRRKTRTFGESKLLANISCRACLLCHTRLVRPVTPCIPRQEMSGDERRRSAPRAGGGGDLAESPAAAYSGATEAGGGGSDGTRSRCHHGAHACPVLLNL